MRGLCGDAFVVAHKRHAHKFAPRHLVEHKHRFETRGHAVGGVRVKERCMFGSDDEFAFAERVERAATTHAVDGSDDGLPQVGLLRAELEHRVVHHERRVGLTVVHRKIAVDAGTECFVASAGKHDNLHGVVVADLFVKVLKFSDEREVAGVVLIGPVQRDDSDTVGDIEQHSGKILGQRVRSISSHRGNLPSSRDWLANESVSTVRIPPNSAARSPSLHSLRCHFRAGEGSPIFSSDNPSDRRGRNR